MRRTIGMYASPSEPPGLRSSVRQPCRSGAFEADAGGGVAGAASPRRAIDPAAPAFPADLVRRCRKDDMRTRGRALTAWRENAKAPDDRAYFALPPGDCRTARGESRRRAGDASDRPAGRAGDAMGGQDPVRAGRDRAGLGEPGRRRAVDPYRGRTPPGRRPQGSAGRGLSCVRPPIAGTERSRGPARPERRLRSARPGTRPGQEPGLAREVPLRDGPGQPGGQQRRPGRSTTSRLI